MREVNDVEVTALDDFLSKFKINVTKDDVPGEHDAGRRVELAIGDGPAQHVVVLAAGEQPVSARRAITKLAGPVGPARPADATNASRSRCHTLIVRPWSLAIGSAVAATANETGVHLLLNAVSCTLLA